MANGTDSDESSATSHPCVDLLLLYLGAAGISPSVRAARITPLTKPVRRNGSTGGVGAVQHPVGADSVGVCDQDASADGSKTDPATALFRLA